MHSLIKTRSAWGGHTFFCMVCEWAMAFLACIEGGKLQNILCSMPRNHCPPLNHTFRQLETFPWKKNNVGGRYWWTRSRSLCMTYILGSSFRFTHYSYVIRNSPEIESIRIWHSPCFPIVTHPHPHIYDAILLKKFHISNIISVNSCVKK